jgi:hypothetical protein
MVAMSYYNGLFKVHGIMRATMAMQLKYLLAQYELLDKVLSYVKDEGANLNTFTMALMSINSCAPFILPQPYVAIYYGHAMSKRYQYATYDFKVCNGMREVSIKAT